MSGNYWESTQRKQWKFTRETLRDIRNEIVLRDVEGGIENGLTSWDPQIRVYVFNLAQALGQRLGVRQRVISTAQAYLLRLFTNISIHEINIFLLVATSVYIACKSEEVPQHILTVCNESRVLWNDLMPTDSSHIAECEFYMISELGSSLIVYHPYHSLELICASMQDWNSLLTIEPEELQGITSVINDSFASDIPLLYSPSIIATACLYITLVLRPQLSRPPQVPERIRARVNTLSVYLGKSDINLEETAECVQDLVSLYVGWEDFDHIKVHEKILKIINGTQ